jgi:hypothetical protein
MVGNGTCKYLNAKLLVAIASKVILGSDSDGTYKLVFCPTVLGSFRLRFI